jgi:hypothetical protein
VGNEQIRTENYEVHLYDRKDDPTLMTPLQVPRQTLNDHTTSPKHGKKAKKGSSQQQQQKKKKSSKKEKKEDKQN